MRRVALAAGALTVLFSVPLPAAYAAPAKPSPSKPLPCRADFAKLPDNSGYFAKVPVYDRLQSPRKILIELHYGMRVKVRGRWTELKKMEVFCGQETGERV